MVKDRKDIPVLQKKMHRLYVVTPYGFEKTIRFVGTKNQLSEAKDKLIDSGFSVLKTVSEEIVW